MGDIADWLLGSQDPFGWDGQECEWWDRPPRSNGITTCRFCGNAATWGRHAGKWRLFASGAVHTCRPNPDAFDVVPE